MFVIPCSYAAARDAGLGALVLGDIGAHFPPDDPRFAGARSTDLARQVAHLAGARGGRIVSLDLTLGRYHDLGAPVPSSHLRPRPTPPAVPRWRPPAPRPPAPRRLPAEGGAEGGEGGPR